MGAAIKQWALGSATVLLTQGKIGVGGEAVEQDDEFAHDGGEGEFGWFAFGDETLVKV
jgi:hypothetical protein